MKNGEFLFRGVMELGRVKDMRKGRVKKAGKIDE